MLFVNKISTVNFARKLGSKDKIKRKKRNNTLGLARNVLATGVIGGLGIKYGTQALTRKVKYNQFLKTLPKDLPNKIREHRVDRYLNDISGVVGDSGAKKLGNSLGNKLAGGFVGGTAGVGLYKYRKNKNNQYR